MGIVSLPSFFKQVSLLLLVLVIVCCYWFPDVNNTGPNVCQLELSLAETYFSTRELFVCVCVPARAFSGRDIL